MGLFTFNLAVRSVGRPWVLLPYSVSFAPVCCLKGPLQCPGRNGSPRPQEAGFWPGQAAPPEGRPWGEDMGAQASYRAGPGED